MVRTAVASYVALLLRRRLGVLVGDSHLGAMAVLDILRSRDRLSVVYTSWGGQTVHDHRRFLHQEFLRRQLM